MSVVDKRKALGRGLSALIPGAPSSPSPTVKRDYFVVAIEEIHPSRQNPRRDFDEAGLKELAESIAAQGIIQPLVVRTRPNTEGGGFTLIAGERRWRAAQKAGLKDLPVVVKEASSAAAFELALVENLQRKDLNAMEEADGYRRLSDECGYTAEQLASRVGKERSTIANALRLLKLPAPVRGRVAAGELQAGHARALLGLEDSKAIEEAAERVVREVLSVRQAEALVQRLRRERATAAPASPGAAPEVVMEPKPTSPGVRDLEQRLQRALGLRVHVREGSHGKGRLEIVYGSLDELDRVLDRLLRP